MFALIDCDNFFVSCEQVFDPELRDHPVVVLSSNDGCVVSRSHKAKILGIPMGVPTFKCRKIFKRENVKILSGNFELYQDMSSRVMNIVKSFDLPTEVYSIDEAFIRITGIPEGKLENLGQQIKDKVRQWTGIPISIGIAETKTLAKVATEKAKNHPSKKVFFLNPRQKEEILSGFPIKELWGIGHQSARKLKRNGVFTAQELVQQPDQKIKKLLSIRGPEMKRELQGRQCIRLHKQSRPKHSIRTSKSFGQPVRDLKSLKSAISSFSEKASRKLRKNRLLAGQVTPYISTGSHASRPRKVKSEMSLGQATAFTPAIIKKAVKGLKMIFDSDYKYKKAGIILSELRPEGTYQPHLFDQNQVSERQAMMKVVDRLKSQGVSIHFASSQEDRSWTPKKAHRTQRYTTRWSEIPVAKAL